MYDLTGFQRDLLYVIAGLDEPHGLAIKEELEDYYEKEIHHGRLYPNLDTLVEGARREGPTRPAYELLHADPSRSTRDRRADRVGSAVRRPLIDRSRRRIDGP